MMRFRSVGFPALQSDDGPTQPADPQRTDPADPIGSAPAPLAPMAVEFVRPPHVVITRVVEVRDKLPDRWATWRATLAGEQDVRRIANAQLGRRNLLVLNRGTGSAYVGPDASVSAASGWPVAAGGTWTTESTAEVYACSDAGTTPELVVMSEFERQVDDRG